MGCSNPKSCEKQDIGESGRGENKGRLGKEIDGRGKSKTCEGKTKERRKDIREEQMGGENQRLQGGKSKKRGKISVREDHSRHSLRRAVLFKKGKIHERGKSKN